MELDRAFLLLNVYGLYGDCEVFWNNLFGYRCVFSKNLMIGGHLNFTLNRDEIWGEDVYEDQLAHFFLEKMKHAGIFYVESALL